MKFLALATLLFASFAQAQDLRIDDQVLTDIRSQGLTKEALFSRMDRRFIKLGGSICANRAHMWSFDFERFNGVDSGKLFLFYTKKTGEGTTKTWWYHVTPVINEGGKIWTMDAGFPGGIKRPLETFDWLYYFAGSRNCKEIKDTDTDLIERMFRGQTFPQVTSHGNFDCYYRYVPGYYWFPSHIATNLLGRDAQGRPARLERQSFNRAEVFQACVEATTGAVSRWLGGGKKECEEWMSLR